MLWWSKPHDRAEKCQTQWCCCTQSLWNASDDQRRFETKTYSRGANFTHRHHGSISDPNYSSASLLCVRSGLISKAELIFAQALSAFHFRKGRRARTSLAPAEVQPGTPGASSPVHFPTPLACRKWKLPICSEIFDGRRRRIFYTLGHSEKSNLIVALGSNRCAKGTQVCAAAGKSENRFCVLN